MAIPIVVLHFKHAPDDGWRYLASRSFPIHLATYKVAVTNLLSVNKTLLPGKTLDDFPRNNKIKRLLAAIVDEDETTIAESLN
ncbi:MAG: hypothetical protein ACAF41_04290 [Leptolyngbya sp. BL-A-14]